MERFRYLAFEGIDGVGKTTQIRELCSRLVEYNYTPICLAEPTNGRHGRRALELLRQVPRDPAAEEAAFTADRREHVMYKVDPLLRMMDAMGANCGFNLVQDRSFYSSPAYQATDEPSMMAAIEKQKAFAPVYDAVILLDVSVDEACRRMDAGGRRRNLIRDPGILAGARERYLILAGQEPNFVIVDGNGESSAVAERVWEALGVSRFEPALSDER